MNSYGGQVTSPNGYSWCLPPEMNNNSSYYSISDMRTATISGTWVLVADGQQKAAEIKVPVMYAGSFSAAASGDKTNSILPSNITLRVSSLECTVNTPTSIPFGGVMKKTQVGAELAVQSYPLITNCGQSSDFIDANINLQFRALSGLYKSAPTRLALRQGGGYITGEIDNGVTGSGNCATTSGLPFDNRQLKIGRITQAETSLSITNQVTWRLCSGGKDLPLGNVSAAAEMLVTFN
ncbi:adhesin [Serratia fonticola]|uniref:adhesin n=2 Tax=Serratia fonticola TaxID=47917 RepID=UPI0021B71F01|nr:adhesin [Serratia fonticola]